jgi:Outer membrane protein beta-barrel domain
MKKIIFFAAVFLCVAAKAQTFQVGAKGGLNINTYTGGDFQDAKKSALVGFHLGGFFNFKFGDNFSIQPEALFSTQGVKLEDDPTPTVNGKYRVAYVNVPVMFKFKTDGGFYIEAGPQIGFRVSEDVPNNSIKDFAKSNDLSIAGGLGYHGKSGFGIGARYIAGLSKVGDFNSNNIDPNFKNSVIQAGIFYALFNNK